jgi:hypothetical protein
MTSLVRKIWPKSTVQDVAECTIMLSVLMVAIVSALRLLGLFR